MQTSTEAPKNRPVIGKRGPAWLAAVLAIFAMLAASCSSSGSSGKTDTAGGGSTTTAAAGSSSADSSSGGGAVAKTPDALLKKATASLNGGGSSFQDTFEQAAIKSFGDASKKAGGTGSILYTKSGSSDGKKQLAAKTLDFAGTDSLLKPEEKATYGAREILYFPLVSSPITLSYKLSGVTDLKLSPDTIAKIVMGQIKTWDDPVIKADNPSAKLAPTAITWVHRSDGSGTTSNFSKYLKAAAPSIFTLDSGDTVQWPVGQGAQNNTGVATVITQTDGAIGYVDLPDAAKANLDVAQIKNAAGKFTKPTPAGAGEAVASADVAPDLTYNPLNAKGATAYPITSPTWILVDAKQSDQAKADTVKAYLTYIFNEGQADESTTSLFYAKLPDALRKKALAQVDKITVG